MNTFQLSLTLPDSDYDYDSDSDCGSLLWLWFWFWLTCKCNWHLEHWEIIVVLGARTCRYPHGPALVLQRRVHRPLALVAWGKKQEDKNKKNKKVLLWVLVGSVRTQSPCTCGLRKVRVSIDFKLKRISVVLKSVCWQCANTESMHVWPEGKRKKRCWLFYSGVLIWEGKSVIMGDCW